MGSIGDSAAASTRERPLTVAQLLRLAGDSLDRGVGLLWLEAEVAECKRAASGHVYLQLRDRGSGVPAVMWARDAARVKFALEVGQRLRVRGRLGVYERDGRMQLYVDFVEPAGLGAAALALEQLRTRLAAEGLFAAARKRPLPWLPRRIGVVTSAQGAALRDILRTIERRFPVPVLISDCAVQGAGAPRQIVAALELVVRAGVDVVIIGRGGGSASDLSAYNDERLVRAVATCPVPVVSAVGHEIDLSLCDLAADQRASTPTAAAELVVPVRAELSAMLAKEERRLHRDAVARLDRARQDVDHVHERLLRRIERAMRAAHGRLDVLDKRLGGLHPRAQLGGRRRMLGELVARLEARHPGRALVRGRAELIALSERAAVAERRRCARAGRELAAAAAQLHALSPLGVLERGYAMVRLGDRVIRDPAEVAAGEMVDVRVARGRFNARVERVP